MSPAIDCINDLRYLSRQSKDDGLTYLQRCDLLCQQINFNNFHHFQRALPNLTDDQIGKISTSLMRRACAKAQPKFNQAYFELIAQRGRRIRYYSYWDGWDERGQEVRLPRALDGFNTVPRLRDQLPKPVYVIETGRQLVAWRHKWYGMAYVPAALAQEHMEEAFARKEAIVEGARNRAFDLEEDFNSNYATWYPVGE